MVTHNYTETSLVLIPLVKHFYDFILYFVFHISKLYLLKMSPLDIKSLLKTLITVMDIYMNNSTLSILELQLSSSSISVGTPIVIRSSESMKQIIGIGTPIDIEFQATQRLCCLQQF